MDKEIKNIKMGVHKCESCGGNLEIDLDKKRAICPYCRTEYTIKEEKKGAVESVIGFIERQQKIKQDKKDEELKKKEEERLKWEQESQANKGRNLIICGGVIVVCVILFIILAINENITESKNKKAGKISAPISCEDVKGKNYEDVETQFKKEGFTNIETKPLGDMVVGLFSDEGDVDKVSIDGETDYSSNEYFKKDVKVVIRYHSYPEDNKKTGKKDDISESKNNEVDEKKESTNEKDEEENTLTIKNCAELKKILSNKVEIDDSYSDFADKYEGRIIEYDGRNDYCTNHGSYNTRFDYLVSAGDYDPDHQIGPTFKFEDVNYFDLNTDIDTVSVGLNVRIKAKVESFDSNSDLFYLEPVKITER